MGNVEGSSSQLHLEYKKMQAAKLSMNALDKSEEVIHFTLNGLDKKGNMQDINRIILYTVEQTELAQREGYVDWDQHENLVEAFEKIANTVAKDQDTIKTLHSESIDCEMYTGDESELQTDSAFVRWKQKQEARNSLAATIPVAPRCINSISNIESNDYDPVSVETGRPKHQREQMQTPVGNTYQVDLNSN